MRLWRSRISTRTSAPSLDAISASPVATAPSHASSHSNANGDILQLPRVAPSTAGAWPLTYVAGKAAPAQLSGSGWSRTLRSTGGITPTGHAAVDPDPLSPRSEERRVGREW